MNRLARLALLLVLVCPQAFAAPNPPDSLVAASASRFMSSTKHVGLSIGVYDHGRSLTWHYGSTEKGRQSPATDETLYEIASLTKTFTGILLAQAVADRRINLQMPVTHYLPGRYPNLTLQGRAVKIVDLANHTSGLPKNLPDLPRNLAPSEIISKNSQLSTESFLNDLHQVTLKTTPGTVYGYSNAGAQLIGIILEKVYRKSYQQLLNDYITVPAGMRHTWLTVPPDETEKLARGYNDKGEAMPTMEQMKALPAAGYLKSSLADMLKYIGFNCMENQNRVLRLAHQGTYMNSAENGADLALFWQTKYYPGQPQILQHAGGSFGTTSYLLIVPERQLGIVCIANDASPDTENELRFLCEKVLSQWIR